MPCLSSASSSYLRPARLSDWPILDRCLIHLRGRQRQIHDKTVILVDSKNNIISYMLCVVEIQITTLVFAFLFVYVCILACIHMCLRDPGRDQTVTVQCEVCSGSSESPTFG